MFKFKCFNVEDSISSMKVGTDAALLGIYASTENANNILEIGTGCGLISLFCAQKSKAKITAIDIDYDSCVQANQNFKNSCWSERLFVENVDLQSYSPPSNQLFDLIISNPPFFSSGERTKNSKRKLARHNDSLNFFELCLHSFRLLTHDGKIIFILALENIQDFVYNLEVNNLFLNKILIIYPKTNFKPKRCIVECSKSESLLIEFERITIRNSDSFYTEEYLNLIKDYYFNF